MDGRTTLLTGILAFILIGGGFLTLAIDNDDTDDNPSNNDSNQDNIENQSEQPESNEFPSILLMDYSKAWDGENITLSGFVIDESPETSTVHLEILNSNAVTVIEPFTVSVIADGSWSVELAISTPGEWFVKSFVADVSSQTSNSSVTDMVIIAPQEDNVVITFLWDEPDENSSIGVLSGVLVHKFPETCSVEYRPKYQSPTLDVTGIMDAPTGSYTMDIDTDTVNVNGTIFASCGLFSTTSAMIEVTLPVPPEPVGDSDLDGILDDDDLCDSTPAGEPVYDTGCSDSETDDDQDGVMNSDDQCPNTPVGETVDFTGCSLSQKDSDNDGVSDAIDTCPETPAGEVADSVGCSPSQKDSDSDGVTDDLDQCPNTPVGDVVGADGCTVPDWTKEESWLCLDSSNTPWAKDLNGEGNSYNSNTRGAGQDGGGGGSGPWFQCDVSVTFTSNNMEINSNAIPNHNWLSAYAANADEQDMDWTIPLNPVDDTSGGHASINCPASNGDYECAPDRGPVAVAVNGVPIFGPEEGPGGDAVALEFLYFTEDRQPVDLGYCGAHNGPGGVHYHYDAMCQFWDDPNGETIVNYDYTDLDSTKHSPIIGWAFDGYPIYGMYGWDGSGQVTALKSSYEVERSSEGGDQGYNGIDDWNYVSGLGDLDQCNGRFAETPEFPDGTYYYVSTPVSASAKAVIDTAGTSGPMIGFPYFLLCYHGEADMSNADAGGGPGPPGGFAAQTIYSHMPEVLIDESDSSDLLGLFWDITWIWLAIIGLSFVKGKKS